MTSAKQRVLRLVRQYERTHPVLTPQERRQRSKETRSRVLRESHLPADKLTGNEAENAFLTLARAKDSKVFRAGWPDFLVEDGEKTIGVEVKRGEDQVSEMQAKMFAALGRAGIRVYVWNPRYPNRLIPWRKYLVTAGREDL